jgi:prepilin-type N-terminal cleavage/methylation domain-containing protein
MSRPLAVTLRPLSGFTLVELAIVLVIIGLIIGGVLVGKSMIDSAKVTATISQINRYNQALSTFRLKYDNLPGDIPDPTASHFGFLPRGQYAGEGDGNSIIEGVSADAPSSNYGYVQIDGETATFWVDLSTANLIPDTLNFGGPGGAYVTQADKAAPYYLPTCKLVNGTYIYVLSMNGRNFLGMSAIDTVGHGPPSGTPGLTVTQAHSIDQKIDDGLPQSGNVTAIYLNNAKFSSPFKGWAGTTINGNTPYTNATTGSASTCFDNHNTPGPQQYSVAQNGGSGLNCALSFGLQ